METAYFILAIGIVAVVGIAILILRLIDRFTLGPSVTTEERAEYERQFQTPAATTMGRIRRPLWLRDAEFASRALFRPQPVASDDFGNYFYVEVAPNSQEAPVFFVDHDGGDISPVADTLEAFLSWQAYSDTDRPA